jgi:hypothetical protein
MEPSTVMKALRAVGLYTLLTVVFTYPLATRLRIMDPGDSAFFAWIMGWTVHTLKTDPLQLPHANIYHPARYTLGMDEPIVGTSILALPLSLFTDDAVLMLNVVRLLTYILSALGIYLFVRELGSGEGAALFAGAAFAFSPMRADQVAHISTLGTQWLPLVFLFTHRFARTAAACDALLAAFFFVLAGWACGYHGILGLVLLPPAALVLLWGRWDRLPKALPAVTLAAAGLYPLYLLHREAFDPHGFIRGREETIFYSASIESFFATSPWNRLYGSLSMPFRKEGGGFLFPGLVVPALVLLGVWRLVRARRWPSRDALALLVVATGALVIALGPEVRFMGKTLFHGPYGWMRENLPLFQNIRVTSRAGIFIGLALVVLAARALDAWRPKAPAFAAIFGLAMAETIIAPIPLASWAEVVDSSQSPPAVYQWLKEQPGEFAIIELPIVANDGYFRRPAFDETIYMVYSTLHWKRLVNGYAGVEPADYRKARELALRFPSQEFVDHMRQLGVRYVIVHRRGFGPFKWARVERDLPAFLADGRLAETARFGDDVVYTLEPTPGTAPR